jgi:hypothetical protein
MIILFKRGNTAAATTFVGAEGSIFIDTEAKQIRLQDGVTAGGKLFDTGLNETEVQALIDASTAALELAISKVTGLQAALDGKVDDSEVGNSIATLVAGKVPAAQLPDPVVVPVKATGAELIAGTDDDKFATGLGLLALLTDIGFTKDGDGWHLDAGVVTP